MKVYATSRQQAGAIAAAALEFTPTVTIANESGYEASFVVEFDERVVMSNDEIVSVVMAGEAL